MTKFNWHLGGISVKNARRVLLVLAAAGVLWLLWAQSQNSLWAPHLGVDVATYNARADYFFAHSGWAGMQGNEYQPGALWFFVLAGWIFRLLPGVAYYVTIVILLNLLLVLLSWWFSWRYISAGAAWTLLAVAAASGPIILFRFELLVAFLVFLAWWFWVKKKTVPAALLLGVATAVKIYPVILLPLMLLEPLKKKNWKQIISIMGLFGAGGLLPLLPFFALGGDLTSFFESLRFHALKPVGLEGIWGSLIPIIQQLAGIPLRITPGYGVHGLTSDLPILTNDFLNWFWLLPYALTLGYIVWSRRRHNYRDGELAFVLLAAFVLFSKNVNPQYLWWFAALLPLVRTTKHDYWLWMAVTALVAIGLAMTQVIYPLNYSAFLDWFHHVNSNPSLFYFNAVRNFIFLEILAVALLTMRYKKHGAK